MLDRRQFAALTALGLLGRSSVSLGQTPEVKPEERSFKSSDGVKLNGLFYKSPKGKDSPLVVMLHGYRAKPDDAVWDDTAKMAVSKGLHVFRFDFRGHGKSTDIVPDEFWANPINKQLVTIKSGFTAATKNTIKYDEFKTAYFPMLVQDLAAVRTELDIMNDAGLVNTSSIYFLGSGEMAYLGLFFIATEWLRERIKPDAVLLPPNLQFVSPQRPLVQMSDPAGQDYAGAIWLSPEKPASGVITDQMLKSWVLSPYALKLRNETAMLFMYGQKDTKSAAVSKTLFTDVLIANAKTGPGGQPLPKPDLTFMEPIKDTALAGPKLLGNNLGTETRIGRFLTDIDKERRAKTSLTRKYDKPFYIDVRAFGAIR